MEICPVLDFQNKLAEKCVKMIKEFTILKDLIRCLL